MSEYEIRTVLPDFIPETLSEKEETRRDIRFCNLAFPTGILLALVVIWILTDGIRLLKEALQ